MTNAAKTIPDALQSMIEKAMVREVPLLTQEQIDNCRQEFYFLRSEFSAWCITNQMFYTLALLATCEIRMDHALPSLAAVGMSGKKIEIFMHPLIVELWKADKNSAFFLFCHELRHIVQATSLRSVENLVDLEPIREVFEKKRSQAKDQAAIDGWQKAIDDLDNKDSHKWRSCRAQIANVTMDAALHQDVMKIFPKTEPIITQFFRDRFCPYMSGFSFETIAGDAIAAGRGEESLNKILESLGPVKIKEHKAKKKSGATETEVLAHAMSLQVHAQTVATMVDYMNGTEGFTTTLDLKEKYEWLQLSDEYVRWMAFQMDQDMDAESPPQDGGESFGEALAKHLSGMPNIDSHEFGENMPQSEREELERKVRDAVRRAEQEGRAMAHRAGSAVGDQDMMGDSTVTLDKRITEMVNKLKIKFVRIFQDSNRKRYSFDKINRLFSDISYLPGHRKEVKPMPQVVLVLDTSGSMWCKQYVNQMMAIARLLHNQNKLAAMYFCDTQLHRVNFKASAREQEVIGGGGTELDVKICEEIQATENFSKGWELVYATDEYCPGLKEAKKDNRWKIHVINVPKLLGDL